MLPKIVKVNKRSFMLYMAAFADLIEQNFGRVYLSREMQQKYSIETAQQVLANKKHGLFCFAKDPTFDPRGYAVFRLNFERGSNENPPLDACLEQCFAGGKFPNITNFLLIQKFVYTVKDFCDQVEIKKYPDVFMELPSQLESEVSRYEILGFNPIFRDERIIKLRGDFGVLSSKYEKPPSQTKLN